MRIDRKAGAIFLCLLMTAMVFTAMPVPAEKSRTASRDINERAVLMEVFTATNCGYCPGADGAMDRMVSNYGNWAAGYWPNRTSLIEWHNRGDAYQNNDGVARGTYYNLQGDPTVVVDGHHQDVGGNANANTTSLDTWYKGDVDGRSKQTVVRLTIAYTVKPDWTGGTFNVTMVGVQAHTNTTLHARVVIVEDLNTTFDGAMMRYTGRKMVYDQPVTINNGDTKYASGNYNIDSHWNKYHLGFVAFVQSDSTTEVLGSNQKMFPGNKAPVLQSGTWDITMNEDTISETLNLDNMFKDPESAPLTFTVTNQGSGYIASEVETNHTLKLTPAANWFGSEPFQIKATDGDKTTTATITVTVVSVNDPPTVKTPIAAFSMNEGATDKHINLGNVFNDVDNPTLTYTFTGQVHLGVSITNKIVSIVSPIGWNGVENITFTATDTGGLFATSLAKVTVKHVNHAPTVKNHIGDKVMAGDTTDTSINLNNVFVDIDNDTLAFTASGNANIVVTIDQVTGIVTLAPKLYWNGAETITFSCSDNIATPVTDPSTVTVTPVNHPPVKSGSVEKIEFDEDNTFITEAKLSDIFSDPDSGQTLTYTVSAPSEHVTTTITDDTNIKFVPAQDWNGETSVTITVSDGLLSVEYSIPIKVDPVNDAPVLTTVTPTGDVGMNEGTTKDFQVTATDPDGDSLTYTWTLDGKDTGIKTNNYTYAPDFTTAGIHKVKITVSDLLLTATKEWKVTVKNVNRAPVVNITSPVANPVTKYKQGKMTFTADTTDPDSDKLTITWYVDGNPVPSSNANSVVYNMKSGTHVVKVTASDGTTSTSQEVTVSAAKTGGSPGFEVLGLLGALVIVAVLIKRKK